MKVKEIMERAGTTATGRAIAYIKDALAEINSISETHVTKERMDITEDKRFYDIPMDCVKILDIRCKHYNNEDEKYRSIPRTMYEPEIVDADGN
mgnify:CR=1 FL=1|tara:strand:- start:675 stop:956 length:282 start_codon:yes stop_codon:yes gene_type:complete